MGSTLSFCKQILIYRDEAPVVTTLSTLRFDETLILCISVDAYVTRVQTSH